MDTVIISNGPSTGLLQELNKVPVWAYRPVRSQEPERASIANFGSCVRVNIPEKIHAYPELQMLSHNLFTRLPKVLEMDIVTLKRNDSFFFPLSLSL